MFCVYCGTQIPDDAVFCSKCGKSQKDHLSPRLTQSVSTSDWEYWTWDANAPTDIYLSARKFEDKAGSRDGMTEGQARLHFWQKIQSRVLPVIQQLRDDGWEPITEVGPSAIRLDTKFRKENGAVEWSKFGKALLFGSTGWNCYGFSIQFRRQRGSGKYSVSELPSLIKRAGY